MMLVISGNYVTVEKEDTENEGNSIFVTFQKRQITGSHYTAATKVLQISYFDQSAVDQASIEANDVDSVMFDDYVSSIA